MNEEKELKNERNAEIWWMKGKKLEENNTKKKSPNKWHDFVEKKIE